MKEYTIIAVLSTDPTNKVCKACSSPVKTTGYYKSTLLHAEKMEDFHRKNLETIDKAVYCSQNCVLRYKESLEAKLEDIKFKLYFKGLN